MAHPDSGTVVEGVTTTYEYDADNKIIREHLPQVKAWRADGTSYNALVTHEIRYDLSGRAVREFDVSDDAAIRVILDVADDTGKTLATHDSRVRDQRELAQ